MSTLKDEINSALKNRCLDEGFKKKGYCYFRESSHDDVFHDLLNFGQYTYSSGRGIDVAVGIRHIIIERLYVQLTDHREGKAILPIPIFMAQLGYLEPEYKFKDWFFKDNTNLDGKMDEIFKEIRLYAYPFYTEFENVERLIEAFEKRELLIGRDYQFYMLPLLYMVVGQKEKGIDFLNNGLQPDFRVNEFMQKYIERYQEYPEEKLAELMCKKR